MPDNELWNETFVEKRVTYSVEVNGRFVIIEDVPARVNVETGERYFSPETVELLQQAVLGTVSPYSYYRDTCVRVRCICV